MTTSKLQRYTSNQLSIWFGGMTIRENYRPDWLITNDGARLELDFYIEDIDIAIEVQGEQHYEFVPFFHGTRERFQKRKDWDNFKRCTCAKRGVILYEVFDTQGVDEFIFRMARAQDVAIGEVGFDPIPTKKLRKLIITFLSHQKNNQALCESAYNEMQEITSNCNPLHVRAFTRKTIRNQFPKQLREMLQ